jgi:hypothetical protein
MKKHHPNYKNHEFLILVNRNVCYALCECVKNLYFACLFKKNYFLHTKIVHRLAY